VNSFRLDPWSQGLLWAFGIFLLVVAIKAWRQPKPYQASCQYDEFSPGFEGGAERFYALVFERLEADLRASQLPFSSLSFGPRELFSKRSCLSPPCLYLQVRYLDLSYYIYAVPAPGGLHVSTWFFSRAFVFAGHPIFKWLFWWRWSRMTLFQFDMARLFHYAVAGAIYAVLNELRAEQGLRPLEEFERRPVLRGFYASMRGAGTFGSGSFGSGFQGGVTQQEGLLPISRQPVFQDSPSGSPAPHIPINHLSSTHHPSEGQDADPS
jgi:hypothetical protein